MDNNNNNTLHPEMWHENHINLNEACTEREEIKMVMSLEITTSAGEKMYNLFTVIDTKNGFASARHTVSNLKGENPLSQEVASYPIDDVDELIEEHKNKALNFATTIIKLSPGGLTIDTSKPVAFLRVHKENNHTDKETLYRTIKESQEGEPKGEDVTTAIINILKLAPNNNNNFQIAPVMPETEEDKKLNNIERALKEQALIKKFGKKKIEDLAKKMNYYGEIVNKIKSN